MEKEGTSGAGLARFGRKGAPGTRTNRPRQLEPLTNSTANICLSKPFMQMSERYANVRFRDAVRFLTHHTMGPWAHGS